MLLLNDLTLIDGLNETIGDPDEPGVDLADIYGWPDSFLVTLVADRWEELKTHFGDSLIQRLSASHLNRPSTTGGHFEPSRRWRRPPVATPPSRTWSTTICHQRLRVEPSHSASRFLSFRRRSVVLELTGRPELVVRAAEESRDNHDRFERVTKWALTELLDLEQWQVETKDVRDALAVRAVGRPRPRRRNARARADEAPTTPSQRARSGTPTTHGKTTVRVPPLGLGSPLPAGRPHPKMADWSRFMVHGRRESVRLTRLMVGNIRHLFGAPSEHFPRSLSESSVQYDWKC